MPILTRLASKLHSAVFHPDIFIWGQKENYNIGHKSGGGGGGHWSLGNFSFVFIPKEEGLIIQGGTNAPLLALFCLSLNLNQPGEKNITVSLFSFSFSQ